MEIEIIDKFKFTVIGSVKTLLVESAKLKRTVEFIRKKKIRNIELNEYYGYRLKDVSFLEEVGDVVEDLTIVPDSINLEKLYAAGNLKNLFVGGENKSPIDFSFFKSLDYCNIYWHKDLSNLDSCKKLRELVVRKYAPAFKGPDITMVPASLRKLHFIQPAFEDLKLLVHFKQLQELDVSYNKKLVNIGDLKTSKTTLKKLRLDNCKKISDYSSLADLKNLVELGINGSANIPSLRFIKGLSKLKSLTFVGTLIVDGDLSYCDRLSYVGFMDRKTYNRTSAQLRMDEDL